MERQGPLSFNPKGKEWRLMHSPIEDIIKVKGRKGVNLFIYYLNSKF